MPSYAEMLVPEFDQEMASTRNVLERLPDDKWNWKAHPKSNTIGWNATHLADIPSWLEHQIHDDFFDEHPVGGKAHAPPDIRPPNAARAVVEVFDRNVALGRRCLAGATDEHLNQPWSLKSGGKVLFTWPRRAIIRTWVFNHIIHHRAILTVYLRLNNIPVPGIYGPSGDDIPAL